MEFSKDNIVSKLFSKKFIGGLDEFEVRDFLHVLAEEIRHRNEKNRLQQKKIQDLEDRLKDYRGREQILQESIANAEKWAEKVRRDAEENSALVLEKARGRSDALIQDARHSLQTVYNDIADLKRLQLQFKTGLKAALQVQMDLLDQDPVFSPSAGLEGLLGKKEEPPAAKKESLKPLEETTKQEGLEAEEAQPPANFKADNEEMLSLKESLRSLDKSFS